jgi:methionyl-tRNA formyltransferase
MRIVFMGTPEVAAFSLERLLRGSDPVIGVVTQPDRPSGRGQKTTPSPVRRIADSQNLPVLAPEKIRDPSVLEMLKKWAPDLIVVVAYGRILPPQILELAPHGCLNVHYSLLPKYRGAAPVAWAIINGEKRSGVTTMRLVDKMDAGPIFLQRAIPLAEDETRTSLQMKLAPLGAELLLETIAGLKAGKIAPKEQNESEASYAPMLKKEDGIIDWKLPAAAIERRVRGLEPWPSAFTYLSGVMLKIHSARVIATGAQAAPGEVVKADKEDFWVATGDGVLSLEEIQLENKRTMTAEKFLHGNRIEKGARL